MFMHSCARLIVWIVCAAALFALARQGICADVPKWGVHEITLTSPQAHANPFTEVTLQATFSSPSGRTLPVDGFYDGDGNGGQTGNVWKIRFSPDEVGAWTYTTTAVGDANLNGKTGSFSCVNSSSKGPVKVDPMNPHHFRYADGDPFFMRGMWILPMFDNKHDTVRRTNEINWMAAHGYNRVAFGLSGFFPSLGTQIVPWLGSITAWNDASAVDFSGFALSKWKEWDSAILQMKNKGIIADIWFYMDDSPTNGAIGAGSALEKMYFRYAIARWGAFTNTWWNLGLETEEYRSNSWRESMGALVKQWDPYDHVLAIHSGATYYAAGTWQDIIVKQLLRMNGNTPAPQLNSAALKDRSRNKPVLFEEFAIETFSGSHNTIRKLAWPVALSGAYPTYLGSGPDPDMYWTTPDTLVEPEFKRLFDFMERTGYRRMSPNNSLVSGGGSANFCLANVGTEYIVYLSAGGTQTLDLSAANGTIPVEWYNPRDGSVQGQTTVAGRGIRSFNAPDANDWVLHIGRSDTAKSGRIAADESWSGKVLITDDLTIVDAAVTVEAGTEVVFAPAVPGHHCVVAIGRRRGSDRSALIIKGTAQRPVTWRTQRDSARGVIKQEDNGGRFYAHYAYFADLGYEKTQAIRCKSTGDGTKFTIDHCAFEDCTAIQAEAGGEVSLVVRDSRFTRRSHCEQQLSLRAMNGSVTVAGNAIEGRLAAGGDTAHIVENVLIGHDAMLLPFGRDVEVRANIVNVNHDMAYTMLTQYKGFERLRIIDNYFRGSAWQMLGGATGTREVIVRGNVFEGTAYSFHTHEALIMIPAYARVSRNFFLDYGVAGHPGCDWPSRRRWAYVNNICRVIGIGTASKVPAKTKPIVRGNVFLRTAGGVGENIFTSGLTAGAPGGFWADFNCFWETAPSYHPDPSKRQALHYGTADHESDDGHAFIFGKRLRLSPGFGLNDIFPAGPPDEEADPLLTDPLVNVHFTNGEIFSGKVTVYDLLLAIRSGFAPRPNSPLIDMADPRENSDPLVTDGRADIGAVELSSWPSERSRLTVLAEKVRHRWKDLEGDIGALINEYHEAPADRIRSDLAALLDGTRQVPASIRVWSDGQGIGQTRPFRTADAINWLLYMSEGARNKPALIQQAVRAYEKERGSWIGIALAHCGDPAAVDFLVNVLKARRDDANRKVQTLATGLKEGLGLIGRQHALKPLLAAAQAVDPSVSVRVARLLAHFGGEDAASAIVAMHGNKRFFRQKEGIARTLRYVNGADAAPVLGAVLKDKKANLILRMNAARGLGHIGGAAGAGALLNALARPHTGDELARVLGEALAAITEPPIATRLEGLYQANAKADGKVRSHIAFALAAQRQPRLTEQLCRIVADGKLADYARVRAAFTLGQLGSPAAVTSLGAVLRGESSPAAKCAAASALGRIADEAAIKALGEVILSTKDEKVANACANALGISGKQAAEDFLIKAIGETRSLLVRNTASLSLGRLGGERAASTLAKLLDSNDLTTRACAGEGLEAMAGSLNKEAIKVLSRVATSKDEKDYVKEAAALALAATGSPLARPALEKILTDAVGETIFMRKIASSGLLVKCGAGTPELRAKAVAIEDGRRANVGAWYVVGPFSLGGPEGWNETHPAETDTDFARSYTVGDKQLKWTDARRAHEEPYGFYTLRRMRGMYHESAFQADGLVYLATRLDVGSETHGAVFVEVDDGVRLWLNGELVIDEPLRHDRTARRIKRRVHFRKGTNDLRMKLPQLGGPWGFTVYLALPDGVKFRSIPIR